MHLPFDKTLKEAYTLKTLQELFQEMSENDELKQKFIEAVNFGNAEDFAKAQGTDATAEEINTFLEEMFQKPEKMSLDELEQVSGGSLQSLFKDKEYAAAGVEIIGPGIFKNDGYKYNGIQIYPSVANRIVVFYQKTGRRPVDMFEAWDWFDETYPNGYTEKT